MPAAGSELDGPALDLESALAQALLFWDEWRHRRSSQLVLSDRECARHAYTLDCTVPFVQLPPNHPGAGEVLVPTIWAEKNSELSGFGIQDSAGRQVPWMSPEEAQHLVALALGRAIQAATGRPLSNPKWQLVQTLTEPGNADEGQAEALIRGLRGIRSGDQGVLKLIRQLASYNPVLGVLPVGAAGTRQILTYGYDVKIIPPTGRWVRLAAGLGYCHFPFQFQMGADESPATISLEGALAEEVTCRIVPAEPGVEHSERRRVLEVRLFVHHRHRLPAVAWAAATSCVTLTLVATGPGLLDQWQQNNGAAVPLLLAGPALFFGFLIRAQRGPVARVASQTLIRICLLLSLVLVCASATLVGDLRHKDMYWTVAAGLCGLITLVLAIGLRRLRKGDKHG